MIQQEILFMTLFDIDVIVINPFCYSDEDVHSIYNFANPEVLAATFTSDLPRIITFECMAKIFQGVNPLVTGQRLTTFFLSYQN